MNKNGNETKTDFLTERIKQNENFQSIDINEWAFEKIEKSSAPISILELCSGTGRQTGYLLKSFPNAKISCLDISEDSIKTVQKTYSAESNRMEFYCDDVDSFFQKNTKSYDMVFCSYGLYYSKDIQFVLSKIDEFLNPKGRLIVMGPHGDNNKQLFDQIKSLNIHIAQPVLYSSTEFMYKEVIAFGIRKFSETHAYTAVNRVKWQAAEDVLSYWQNSTFYDASKKEEFLKLSNEEIKKNGCFYNDKHIMLIQAIKHG